MHRGIVLLIAACAALLHAGAFAQVPRNAMGADWRATLAGPALLTALREGGYVLYLRHTSTDFGENDDQMTDFADCTKQRNLTDAGRAEARALGAAIRDLKIPIATVYASPYCRTMETGRLVFANVTRSYAVRGGPARPESPERYAALRALLSTAVPPGTNVAISSHGNPFYGVAGPPYLAEGEMAVIEPQGNGQFRVVARIAKNAWTQLK